MELLEPQQQLLGCKDKDAKKRIKKAAKELDAAIANLRGDQGSTVIGSETESDHKSRTSGPEAQERTDIQVGVDSVHNIGQFNQVLETNATEEVQRSRYTQKCGDGGVSLGGGNLASLMRTATSRIQRLRCSIYTG